MIWLTNFPLPPSVNEYLFAVDSRLVKTKTHRQYRDACILWGRANRRAIEAIKLQLETLKSRSRTRQSDLILRVDVWVAFEHSRVFTRTGKCERIDANNYLKALLDGLAEVIGIDDKHFFAGNCEKVTARSKELECSVVRIAPTKARTLDEIRAQMKLETNTAGSSFTK